jgi:hypothetical protein
MYHYVYKVVDTQTGEFYFGSRSCKCNPEEDILYTGSMSTWSRFDTFNRTNLKKEIIRYDFSSRQKATEYERDVIKIHINDPLNRNYHIPGIGYYMAGTELSQERKLALSIRLQGKTYETLFGKERAEAIKKKQSENMKGSVIGFLSPDYKRNGSSNPMFGKSVKDVWIAKYGEEQAEEMWKMRYHNVFSIEVRKRISTSKSGKTYEELYGHEIANIVKRKISERNKQNPKGCCSPTCVKTGSSNPMFGKSVKDVWIAKYGEEQAEEMWKQKYAKRKNKNPWNKNSRPIIQCDKENVVIAEYQGLQDVLKQNPSFNKPNICNVLLGKRKTANGYIWRYK